MMFETNHSSNSSSESSSDAELDGTSKRFEDELFHLLQTSRKRDVISHLLDTDGPIKMGELAELVSAKEHETTVAELTSTQRQRVYVSLYQNHLPELDTKGFIEYNQSRGIVRPTDRLEVFRPYLEAADPIDNLDHADSGPAGSLLTRAISHIIR